jgi:hypothetical protein
MTDLFVMEALRRRIHAMQARAATALPKTAAARELMFRNVARDSMSCARLAWRLATAERQAHNKKGS